MVVKGKAGSFGGLKATRIARFLGLARSLLPEEPPRHTLLCLNRSLQLDWYIKVR